MGCIWFCRKIGFLGFVLKGSEKALEVCLGIFGEGKGWGRDWGFGCEGRVWGVLKVWDLRRRVGNYGGVWRVRK